MASSSSFSGTISMIQVVSDDKHYSPFICTLCQNLVSLDAVVTIRCSHPFCRSCLEAWAAQVYNENGGTGNSNNNTSTNGNSTGSAARNVVGRAFRRRGSAGAGRGGGDAVAATTPAASTAMIVCPCPDCRVDLSVDPSLECMELARTMLTARPLKEAQPLAYACLRRVQVACITCSSSNSSNSGGGGWYGDYGDYLAHATCHTGSSNNNRNGIKDHRVQALIPPPSSSSNGKASSHHQPTPLVGINGASVGGNNAPMSSHDKRPMFPKMLSLPSMFSKDPSGAINKYDSKLDESVVEDAMQAGDSVPCHTESPMTKSQSLQNMNSITPVGGGGGKPLPPLTPAARSFNGSRGLAGSDNSNTNNTSDQPQLQQNNTHEQDAHAVNATAPRWDTNGGATAATATATATALPQVQIHDNGKGDAPPNMVQRTKSSQSTFASPHPNEEENKKPPRPQSSSATSSSDNKGAGAGGNKRAAMTKRNKPPTLVHEDSISDLEASSQYMDWNTSINSLQGWNNSFSEYNRPAMETLEEFGESSDLQAPFRDKDDEQQQQQPQQQGDQDDEKIARVLEQAGKLKKQANAKFNKGDFNGSRSLYTEGINAMKRISRIGPDECELLSNMHSNRAVTFFREKKFDECIQDCDLAIKYDPTYEKSWIRKWRALMAQGRLEPAFASLELGAETIPDSRKIQQELVKARTEMDMLIKARDMIGQGEFQKVHDMLKTQTHMSDNIGILHVAARADAGLGFVESALEKANRALRFNPSQPDGLALRGYVLFVSGETEKGTHLLQDAYGRDKENKKIKLELQRLHKTHSAFNKGRSCVKRGRYSEAVDHFSTAMREIIPLPKKAPLFGMLRVERAEALMLSGKFTEALEDCQDVINAQKENAMAWTVRAEVLIALGRAEEAQKQLVTIRKTWGADNPTIEEGYRRVDFELRVLKADTELMAFVKELEQGNIGGGGCCSGDTVAKSVEQERHPSTDRSGQVHRKSSSADPRRSEKRGERPPSRGARPPPGPDKRRTDEQRRALPSKAKSSRNISGSSGGSGGGGVGVVGGDSRNDSRPKKRPNALERKSMSDRGFDKNRRPSSTKRLNVKE